MHCAASSNAEHAQRLEMLGMLSRGIAHDLNNMLAIVEGYASLVDRELPQQHVAHEWLDTIGDAARRGIEMVRQIMAFGRPSSERTRAQLHTIVESSLRLVRSTLPARVQVRTEFANGVPAVEVDTGQISQIVMNLCVNAAHAIGTARGTITIKVGTEATDPAQVRFSISDTGCGMDEATLQRIFEPYFTTKQPGKGTGLGLSVVREIVAAHGGRVAVRSRIGEGTTFDIYLPAAQSRVTHASQRPSAEHGDIHQIMYVDDDQPMSELMKELLEAKGYAVETFNDPQNALIAFCACPDAYDLTIADVNMPGLGGIELARKMRVIERDMPVVLTSGWVDAEVQATAHAAGLDDVLLKSLDVRELTESLHRRCGGGVPHESVRMHS